MHRVQVFLKKTTTVSKQNCDGNTPVGSPVSKTFQVTSGPTLQVIMSFGTPMPALSQLKSLTASALNIDSRRVESTYVESSRRQASLSAQLEIVTTSMVDARALQQVADSKLVSALAKNGLQATKLTSKIVTPLMPTGSSGPEISRDATIGLAVGLGAGIPLLLLAGFAYYMYQKSQSAAHAKVPDRLQSSGSMGASNCVLAFCLSKTTEQGEHNAKKKAGSHSPQAALMYASCVPGSMASRVASTESAGKDIHIPAKPTPAVFGAQDLYGFKQHDPYMVLSQVSISSAA
jgi:hypothetical protein